MEFRILGPLEVRRGSEVLPLGGPRQRALLAMLLIHAGRVVSTDELIGAVWGDEAAEGALRTLQVHVSNIRRALGLAGETDCRLVTRSPGYVLEIPPAAVDAVRFCDMLDEAEELAAEARAALLGQALEFWRGGALSDFAYAEFARAEIARLDEQRWRAVEMRAAALLELGHHEQLIPELESSVVDEPGRERLWASLMTALYRSGRQTDALDAFRRAREELVDRYGVEPGEELRALERQILLQDEGLALSADAPAPVVLPTPLTPLVGREAELTELVALIARRRSRLVTLTGTGGIGKSRLAVEAARAAARLYPGGVWLVPLAGVSDPARVPDAIAGVLGIRETAVETVSDRIVGDLAARDETLLVLDTFEHLIEFGPSLAELMGRSPSTTVLVTSRVSLRVTGELGYRVGSLSLPAGVELFAERSPVDVSDHTPELRDVCDRLGGVPLAIELAAARLGVLSVPELAELLGSALDLLGPGPRDAPERQRTLRSTISWSFELLSEPARALFSELSVFAGAFPRSAASAVAAREVLEPLAELVDGTLVQRVDVDPVPRFLLLDSIRAFSRELPSSDQHRELANRHLAYHLAWVETQAERGDDHHSFPEFARSYDDLRQALAWAVSSGDADSALRLAIALGGFWNSRGTTREALAWLIAALEVPHNPTSPARAEALSQAGAHAFWTDDYTAAARYFESAIELADLLALPLIQSRCLSALSHIRWIQGDREGSAAAVRRLEELPAVVKDEEMVVVSRSNKAVLMLAAGDYDEALELFRDAVRFWSSRPNASLERLATELGRVATGEMLAGRPALALGPAQEGLRVAQEARSDARIASARMDMALVMLLLGRLGESGAALLLALPRLYGAGDRWLTADGLLAGAALARLTGRERDAGTLRAGGRALRQSLGAVEMPVEHLLNQQFFASDPDPEPPAEPPAGATADDLVALAEAVAGSVADAAVAL